LFVFCSRFQGKPDSKYCSVACGIAYAEKKLGKSRVKSLEGDGNAPFELKIFPRQHISSLTPSASFPFAAVILKLGTKEQPPCASDTVDLKELEEAQDDILQVSPNKEIQLLLLYLFPQCRC